MFVHVAVSRLERKCESDLLNKWREVKLLSDGGPNRTKAQKSGITSERGCPRVYDLSKSVLILRRYMFNKCTKKIGNLFAKQSFCT